MDDTGAALARLARGLEADEALAYAASWDLGAWYPRWWVTSWDNGQKAITTDPVGGVSPHALVLADDPALQDTPEPAEGEEYEEEFPEPPPPPAHRDTEPAPTARFIARHDPAWAWRDAAARREVLRMAAETVPGSERHTALIEVVRVLADVYEDTPG